MMSLTIMVDVLSLHHGQYVSYIDVSTSVCDVSMSQTRGGDSFFKGY
jgi:hypothetical protein